MSDSKKRFERSRRGTYHHPSCYHAEVNCETIYLTADEFGALSFYVEICWTCTDRMPKIVVSHKWVEEDS